MLNPRRVARTFELSLDRARAAVSTAPAPRCPAHPEHLAVRLHLSHPDTILNHRVAFRMGCAVDIDALRDAGYRVEVL